MNLLGVDIGGTKIAAGLVDGQTGAVLLSRREPTNADAGGADVLARAIDLAQQIVDAAKLTRQDLPVAVGVGAGGQIDSVGGTVVAATEILPGWAGIRLRDGFADALSLPCAVDNDVNALAAGEHRWGAAKGLLSVVFLALGTGVGGALISNGKLHHGPLGTGGELGHLVLIPDGELCTCGGRGCLEQYVCGPALLRRFRQAGGNFAILGDALGDLARIDRDSLAAHAIATTGRLLGLGLVSLANLFGPERIVIGGGMASLGSLLVEPARQILEARALPGVRQVPVITAGLGADASVVGAASLIWEQGIVQ